MGGYVKSRPVQILNGQKEIGLQVVQTVQIWKRIYVTERSRKLLRDVRLPGGLNVRLCSALIEFGLTLYLQATTAGFSHHCSCT